MTHVVAEPCFGCKYTDCVVVCPVECFYEGEQILYIHPDECIDCEACVPECPVEAIFHEDNLPEEWAGLHRTERRDGNAVPGHHRKERAARRRLSRGDARSSMTSIPSPVPATCRAFVLLRRVTVLDHARCGFRARHGSPDPAAKPIAGLPDPTRSGRATLADSRDQETPDARWLRESASEWV